MGPSVRAARVSLAAAGILLGLVACTGPVPGDPRGQIGPTPDLPAPHQCLFPPIHIAKIVDWNGASPTVPQGLKVQAFATGLANPRSLYVLPGEAEDVVTGFLVDGDKARGRPVGLAVDAQGGLLIADDTGNSVWRVSSLKDGL